MQIINIKEMRRRLSEAELENLPLPELSRQSDILQEFHLRTVSHYLCLSVCLSLCLSLCLSVRLSVCPSVCLSFRLSVRPSVCPSVCLSVCLSVRPSVCPSVCFSLCLYVCMCVYVHLTSDCLAVPQSVCPTHLSVTTIYCSVQAVS